MPCFKVIGFASVAPIVTSHSNDRKHEIRMANSYDAFSFEDGTMERFHDELVIDCPENERDEVTNILQKEMENAVLLSVPLVADMKAGNSWYETK